MGKNNQKIRYKYRESKKGISINQIRCPTCGSNHINWKKVVQDKNWNGTIILLAECWSGNINKEKPRHLFLIELDDLPVVSIKKIDNVGENE